MWCHVEVHWVSVCVVDVGCTQQPTMGSILPRAIQPWKTGNELSQISLWNPIRPNWFLLKFGETTVQGSTHVQKKVKCNTITAIQGEFMWCERYYFYEGWLHDILNCLFGKSSWSLGLKCPNGNVWILGIIKHYKQNALFRFCNRFLIFKRPLHSQSQFSG